MPEEKALILQFSRGPWFRSEVNLVETCYQLVEDMDPGTCVCVHLHTCAREAPREVWAVMGRKEEHLLSRPALTTILRASQRR